MHRYPMTWRKVLICALILVVSAGTARSAVRVRVRGGPSNYDPFGFQYHYKPWGAYGPELTAPNVPRILDVLEGRAPLNPRVARRVVSPRTVQFGDVNLSVTKPSGPWTTLDPKKSGSHAQSSAAAE